VFGFGACERWIRVDDLNQALATYDLDSLDVLRGAAYKAIVYENLSPWSKRVTGMCTRILRFEGVQELSRDMAAPTGAAGLLLFALNVAPEAEDVFNTWYDEEHIPALAEVPGVMAARRYRSEGGSHRYVAIYYLETPDVTKSEAWNKAIDTPWRARARPYFKDQIRILTGRYEGGKSA